MNGQRWLLANGQFAVRQPCAIARPASIGHLGFASRARLQQISQQQIGGRCVVNVKQTTPKLTVLKRDHPAQPPKRALIDRHPFGRHQLLGPAGHHPEAWRCRVPLSRGQRLYNLHDRDQISFLLLQQRRNISTRRIIKRPQIDDPTQG